MKKFIHRYIFLLFLLVPLSAQATLLYVDDSAGNLGTVNTTTGTYSLIGNMGVQLTDIAFDSSGNLYGISFTNLYKINSLTAATTEIGSLGLNGANGLTFGSDGTLYTSAFNTSQLYTVNKLTGATSLLGSTGYSSAGDLAFNGGNLYLSAIDPISSNDELVEINLSGGVSGTLVGNIGFQNVFGLATGSDGILYGTAGNDVISINTSTGAGSLVTTYSDQYGNYGATAKTSVPEPSTVLLLGAGFTGVFFWGRKRFPKLEK